MAEIQAKMENLRVKESAGGGVVTAEANGNGKITNLEIDQDFLSSCEAEELSELILVAVNRAVEAASQKHAAEMKSMAGGMLPGLF